MPDDVTILDDAAMIERLQRGAFAYFTSYANPENGLIADTSRVDSPCSIAVVGFALSCYVVAVRRGWLSREDAALRTLKAVDFFWRSANSDRADATGYKGFYYHFLDMHSGRRVWQCELSLIDTALLLAGMLCAACFFDADSEPEAQIRRLVHDLYRRADWRWAQNDSGTLAQGWKPEGGFLHYGWEGYNEATILYVLGGGSPTHALPPSSFAAWTITYQWENLLGRNILYSGPLFTHLFSHAWLDFRGIRDEFMREAASDYFENTRSAIAIQREYAARNPRGFAGYGADLWGVTAGDGPGPDEMQSSGRDRRCFGYMSRGVPYGPDDGTIAPWVMAATLPFDADSALRGTRSLLARYPQVLRDDQFTSGFNPSLTEQATGWLSEGCYGLDQGLLVMMIENQRTGLIWQLMRGCAPIRRGLRRSGFAGGWLDDVA
ncbi:MAG TPA: glucoamylase family protein [Steroidobacteraceae bacterium]|nr:glucoamylase family protein [Steroidobacteraceae bacterium]